MSIKYIFSTGITGQKYNMAVPIYNRLGMTLNEFENCLNDLYKQKKFSQKEIAAKLGCHVSVVERYCKSFGINARNISERTKWEQKKCDLDGKLDIIDGMILADGHLDPSNVSARLTYGCKHIETLNDIKRNLGWHFSKPWRSEKSRCYHFKSSFYNNLLPQRNRWYKNGVKIVPKDIKLTPVLCYWWFVGDGYMVDYGVSLCTDSFSYEDNLFLVDCLESCGFKSHITKSTNRIRISGRYGAEFLSWIKENVNVSKHYEYKWHSRRLHQDYKKW